MIFYPADARIDKSAGKRRKKTSRALGGYCGVFHRGGFYQLSNAVCYHTLAAVCGTHDSRQLYKASALSGRFLLSVFLLLIFLLLLVLLNKLTVSVVFLNFVFYPPLTYSLTGTPYDAK